MRADYEDEQRRLSVFHLVGLAAGGMIGSGWLLGANEAFHRAGSDAYLAWVFGGLLMLLIAAVMVELGTVAPKTGGLVFLPLQSSGALVATVVAAGLWIFYAINLSCEAVAMTRGLSWKVRGLLDPSQALTLKGWGYALGFMAAISAVNLAAPRIFFRINSWLTVVKVVIPVLTVALLIAAGFDHHSPHASGGGTGKGAGAALAAVVDSGVIFAYVGFQGPLDFAGNIKRWERGIREAARLRRAVFGTITGAMVLYISLQVVFTKYQAAYWNPAGTEPSPYAQFAFALSLWWLLWLLRIGAVISPMGAGLVFAHALTREVAALSRAHLTHRGLQTAHKASLRRRYDVYWLVLVVDFFVAGIALLAVGGSWNSLVAITGVLTLVVYAVPGVVLVSLRDHLTGWSRLRRGVREVLARAGFALIALILYGAGWASLWRGMATLTAGCALLLCLPILARWLPAFGRMYDAKVHVTRFRLWRTSPAAQAALWLTGHLALLTLLTLLGNSSVHVLPKLLGGFLAVAAALVAFEGLVDASRRHMAEVAPMLPTPVTGRPAAAANAANE
ncbi:APC family permease [Streptomyces sp. NPDC046759]|uniref:APC family permease n=1 Tax=Streptomyces sp. NPDC046759 TaxID=3155019 RepID=UPI00340DFD85